MANDDEESTCCCCEHRYSPCVLWSSFCSWFVRRLEIFFGCFGEGIAKYPLFVIPVCLVFVSICSVGFVWLNVEIRTVKLFIPQDSQAVKDLDLAEEYFRLKVREEIVLLVSAPDSRNVLNRDCLKQALQAHEEVVKLTSYSKLCATLSGDVAESAEKCMMINPLEVFQFNERELNVSDSQIQANITNPNLTVMRNGRPYQYNFGRMFGDVTKESGNVTGAKALQMVYFLRDPSKEEANTEVLEWEKTFIDKMTSLADTLSCFKVYYSSERSLDDAISESSGSDITLVSITFTLMITFACVMLGKFLNPLTGHSLLANAGVFAVALGILAGFGLAMWCRVPFVSMVGVLPFLILGIGIDDMFILVDELDRQQKSLTVIETVKEVMARSGATITMTTVTDLVAFAVSTSTSFPAIRYFCVYAALTVTFSYLMIVTYFVAIMSYDVRRIKAGRRDCLPFCRAPPPKENEPAWDEPRPQVSNKLMNAWAKFLTHPATKVVVIIFSLASLAAGIYGATVIDENFDRRILAKDDSYLKKFLSAHEQYFKSTIPVSVVVTGDVDYGESSVQDDLKNLANIVTSNKYYENTNLSWIDTFSKYAQAYKKNIEGSNFTQELKKFLNIGQFSYFKQDLKFSDDNTIKASRIIGVMKDTTSSTDQKNAMLTLRQDLSDKSKLDAFPIARPFIFFEQYAIISRETLTNLLIAALAVLVITSPFLLDCTVTILVVFNFVALVLELFGLMVLWDVSLNSVSMINLVMAIGFAVDYSAHIAHAYVMSDKETANERVVDALSTLGASVFMGGFSTFLGMIVLAFAASEIFRIFFRMFLGIVLFGLLHGLCILPVYLSLFCWRPAVTRPLRTRVSVESLPEDVAPENEAVDGESCGKGVAEGLNRSRDLGSASSNEGFELTEQEKVLDNKVDEQQPLKANYESGKEGTGEAGKHGSESTETGESSAHVQVERDPSAEQDPVTEVQESKKDTSETFLSEEIMSEAVDGESCGKGVAEGPNRSRDLGSASSNEGFELTEQEKVLDGKVDEQQPLKANDESGKEGTGEAGKHGSESTETGESSAHVQVERDPSAEQDPVTEVQESKKDTSDTFLSEETMSETSTKF